MKKATAILLSISLIFLPRLGLSQNNPALEVKILSLRPEEGIIFINKGSAQGLKEGQGLTLISRGAKGIELRLKEAFTNSSKLALNDPSDARHLNEGETLKLEDAPVLSRTRISGESRSFVTSYNLGGQNRKKSFYHSGKNAAQEIDLRINSSALKNVNLEGFISARATDDKYLDQEQLSLEGLSLKAEDKEKNYALSLGDFYSYFSNYSLSQSLKGARYTRRLENGLGELNVTGLYGTNKHRWNSFWRAIDGESYTRNISGVRLEQVLNKGKAKVGFNFVDNRDDRKGTTRTGVNPITNSVFSTDIDLNIAERFLAKAEIAEAFTDNNTSAGSSVKTKSDEAYKIDTVLKIFRSKNFISSLSSGFERAGQNFSSLSGILKTDRQEYYTRLINDIYDYFSWRLGFIRSHNNLKDGLSRTTKYQRKELGFTLRPFEARRSLEIALDLDRRDRVSTDTTIKEQSDTAHLVLRDKFNRLNIWGGWQVSKHDDEAVLSRGRSSNIFDLGARYNANYRNFDIQPRLSLQFENRKQDTMTRFDNIVKGLNVGLQVYSPQRLNLNFNYAVTDVNDDILLQNRLRQRLELDVLYFLDPQKTRDIGISYGLNSLENKNSGRDYSESILKVEFRQRF